MTQYSLILPLLALFTITPALAQDEMPEDVETVKPAPGLAPVMESETETELWLLVQSSGQIAGSRYTTPGKVATLSYQRYLNSFKHPIPRQFTTGSGGTSASGSGAGSGSSTSR